MTNLDSILKRRDITLPTKVRLVKAMVFPVVMYGCQSWTVKKAEHRKIDAFELCCWRRLLRVPWTARRSNQSILKEISPGCSLEGLMLKLKLQYLATSCEVLTEWKRPWCWEGLWAGGDGDDRGWDGWMASPTRWTWVWVNSRSWWWTGRPGVLRSMGLQRVWHDWATELNWTELNWTERLPIWHSDKEAACQFRRGKRCRFNPWFSSGRSPGVGNGNPFPYSCLGNSMNGGAWRATVTKGSQRIRHDWAHTQWLKQSSQHNPYFPRLPWPLFNTILGKRGWSTLFSLPGRLLSPTVPKVSSKLR